jgi:tetratricopeptide (TPR) repeat protein
MQGQDRFSLEEYGDRSVLTTWTVSYEQVQRQSDEAAWLLKLWGFLDNGEMWFELIAVGLKLRPNMDVPVWLLIIAEDELAFGEAMGLLSRYSLADGTGTRSHSMHAVLHQWCQYLADDTERYKLGCLATGLVALGVPSKWDVEFLTKQNRIMAHGLCVSGWVEGYYASHEEEIVRDWIQAYQLHNLGYLLAHSDKERAIRMYQRALKGYEKAWGAEHTSTLDTFNNLGNLYANLGRLEEAEQMLRRALEGKEKAWGPEHTSTLGTVHNLGNLYRDLGRLEDAEQMYQRALEGKEKALGPEHTSTLDTVNNLGSLYRDLGRLEEAEQMYQRALEGKEKAWGPEHTSTLDTVNNLANLYRNLGRLEEAEQMYQRALEGKEKALGPEHTSTLNTVHNLGSLYRNLGRLEEAEQLYQRALDGYEKVWGPEHTSTLDTVNNLGILYRDLGRLEEAEQMYQRALDGYAKAMSPDLLTTFVPALGNMWGFAFLREKQGRIDDARHWYSKALLGYEKTYGKDHEKCRPLRDDLASLERERDNR